MANMLTIVLNGTERALAELGESATVADLVMQLGFRPDRVALERNGDIVPRARWAQTQIEQDDRIELVHFVGGGI